jgi:hypothetical protein
MQLTTVHTCILWLFVYLLPPEQFFSYPTAVTITGDRAANLDLCLAHMAFSSKGSFSCHTYCDAGPRFFSVSCEGPAPTSHSGIWTRDARITRSLRLRSNHCTMWSFSYIMINFKYYNVLEIIENHKHVSTALIRIYGNFFFWNSYND